MQTHDLPLISICIPVYNEEGNIDALYTRVNAVTQSLAARYRFEFVFTDNHSTDRTFEMLAALATRDNRIRVLRFSRNFGFQKSILANYRACRGAAAMQLDADLQDPPELLAQFLEQWEQGYKVVYGVRRKRPESWLMHGARRAFYRIIDFLSEDPLPHDAGDFRLIDKCVLDELARIDDQQPYIRGSIASMGFAQTGLIYDRAARTQGESKFNVRRLFSLALDGILNHSIVPLRLATFSGLVVSGVAALGAFYYLITKIVQTMFSTLAAWPEGLASTSILILFGIGMNALLLGIIGEYVGRIYKNVKRQPLVIVEQRIEPARIEPARGTELSAPGPEPARVEVKGALPSPAPAHESEHAAPART